MTDALKLKAYHCIRDKMRELHALKKFSNIEVVEVEKSLQLAAIYLGVFSIRQDETMTGHGNTSKELGQGST